MRIVPRESIREVKLLRLAGRDRPVEVKVVIDVNGRMKVSRVMDEPVPRDSLVKPKGVRFAILPDAKVQPS